MSIEKDYELWTKKAKDETIISELASIKGNADEITDRFYRDLEFGTGGLRGTLGAGTNRMNIYTVARATFGFAEYLLKEHYEFSFSWQHFVLFVDKLTNWQDQYHP